MTTMTIFAIYDSKAKLYSAPVFARSIGEAVRSFQDAVNDKNSPYGRHPGDYTLFAVGTYEDGEGLVSPLAHGVQNLGNGLTYVKAPEVDMRAQHLLREEA